jgi:hypothetical protein
VLGTPDGFFLNTPRSISSCFLRGSTIAPSTIPGMRFSWNSRAHLAFESSAILESLTAEIDILKGKFQKDKLKKGEPTVCKKASPITLTLLINTSKMNSYTGVDDPIKALASLFGGYTFAVNQWKPNMTDEELHAYFAELGAQLGDVDEAFRRYSAGLGWGEEQRINWGDLPS